jgi:formate dehydrogenase subunit gamma
MEGCREPGMVRFGLTERLLHWGFAAGYLLLLVSGLPLMFPALRDFIRGYTPLVGLRLHLAGGVLWLAITLAIVLLGNRRALVRTARELSRVGREDWRWLRAFPRWLLAPEHRARIDATVARFNGGQKLNALFTVITSALLLLTGLALWPAPGGAPVVAAVAGAGVVDALRVGHRWLTLLILAPLAGHVFLATIHPGTRHALHGMMAGRVDRGWAAEHHPRWHDEGTGAA